MKRVYSAVVTGLIIGYSGFIASAQQETKNIISGTVKSIDLEKKEIVLESKDAATGQAQESILTLNDTTEIEYGLVLDDLIIGDELNIDFTTDDSGNKLARSIKFIEEEGIIEEGMTEEETAVEGTAEKGPE